jgi:hypothetical protein
MQCNSCTVTSSSEYQSLLPIIPTVVHKWYPSLGVCFAVAYYSAIVAWSLYYVGASFAWPLPWATSCEAGDQACAADPHRALPMTRSSDYFTNTVMRFDEGKLNSGAATDVAGPIIGCASLLVDLSFACIYISYHYMLCVELLEPSKLLGASDTWMFVGLQEQYTKACRSFRQQLFVLCRSAASSVCTRKSCIARGLHAFVSRAG